MLVTFPGTREVETLETYTDSGILYFQLSSFLKYTLIDSTIYLLWSVEDRYQ